MPAMLALGIGTACIVAAVLLFVSGSTAGAVIAAIAGVVFDLLFVKALRGARAARRS
jgi:hypothetical protein